MMNVKRVLVTAMTTALVLGSAAAAAASVSGERIGGPHRTATSVAISQKAFPHGADVAVLVHADSFPDALVAGAAAGALGAPVLLSGKGVIPDAVVDELNRLNPDEIILVGGPSALSDRIAVQVRASSTVTRWGGETRYDTARIVASRLTERVGSASVAYLASGANFPDALSGGVAAALDGAPLLLTEPERLSVETAAHLKAMKPEQIVILGGPVAVSDAAASAAGKIAPVKRIAGADRFATSRAVSAATFASADTVFLSNGYNYPDGLSGTPLAAVKDAPILLVLSETLPATMCTEIRRLAPDKVVALGGEQVVSDAVIEAAKTCAEPRVTIPVKPEPTPTITAGPAVPDR